MTERFVVDVEKIEKGRGCRWFSLRVEDVSRKPKRNGRVNLDLSLFVARAVKLDDGRVSVFETSHGWTGRAVRRDSRLVRDLRVAIKRCLEAA